MKYCKKCVMPDTRPGISFNAEGVCSACQSYEKRKKVLREFREVILQPMPTAKKMLKVSPLTLLQKQLKRLPSRLQE